MRCSRHRLSLVLALLLTSALTVWSASCRQNVSCSFGCGPFSPCECGWTSSNEGAKFEAKWEFADFGNYYRSVNMSESPGATARYSSPVICAAENEVYSFRFRYSLENGDGCQMTSYVNSGNRRNVLWNSTAFVASTSFRELHPVDIGPHDEDFQIVIEVKKIKSEGCKVSIDDVEYEFLKDVTTTPRETSATVSSPAQVKATTESPTLQSTLVSSSSATSQLIFPSQEVPTSSKSSIFQTSSHDLDEQSTQEKGTNASGTALGTGVGLAVLIIAIISASVAIVIARKKCKMSSDTRTAWPFRTKTTIIRASSNEHLPDNKTETERPQELSDPDGRITAFGVRGVPGAPGPEPTAQNSRVASFGDRVNGSPWQSISQEDYSVLFGPLPREPVTDSVELDTYSHIQRQNEATGVPGDKRSPRKHVAELEQRSSQASSREQKATEDAEDDYSRLRASLTADEVLIGNDTYDHLKHEEQPNVRDLCSTADVYANVSS